MTPPDSKLVMTQPVGQHDGLQFLFALLLILALLVI